MGLVLIVVGHVFGQTPSNYGLNLVHSRYRKMQQGYPLGWEVVWNLVALKGVL